ncbi:glycosyl transferase [Leptolyngbya sp. 'hensonii']|uniref:glycosyltransferase n=1 Tax=Leptolyngbya sp. 'hensonii' TaxID=1922337 RepID=UPI00094F8294|nr:glycosyltransferase family 2 protein [Leptolyngbya sp. 'hensonii']OLP16813.1 glycosyl transferase [Leptolyngbya sp. 'hensonii']
MPTNLWPDDDSYNQCDSVSSLLSDLSEMEEEPDNPFERGQEGRRRKAAVVLTVIWTGTIVLHLVSWGTWFVLGLTTLMSLHALRVILARPLVPSQPLADDDDPDQFPYVSLLVAAKNEEAVIGNLVRMLCNLDYPACRYDLWVINDNSTDRTPILLDQLAQEYDRLHVIHRSANATGGKSGALNQVWPMTRADIIAVFDADARVSRDMLRHVVPLFQRSEVGAVQVRKAILQADPESGTGLSGNFWIQGQMAEMAMDTYYQQQRIAIGGIGELRGNGQFVRRQALQDCGGWNEQTITDDLDLTLRLHLNQWDIDCLAVPAVQEEGVTTVLSLWHQRNRWAEGGYQRYLDYWRLILTNRMGFRKTYDLAMFWLIQYGLPTAAIPDVLMGLLRNRLPILSPITTLSLSLSLMWTFMGLRRVQRLENRLRKERGQTPRCMSFPMLMMTLLQALRGTFYMLHWVPVMTSTTARMAVRPKRLKWVKTIHHGTGDVWVDLAEETEKTA